MTAEQFKFRIQSVPGDIIIDLGTGDGLYVYHSARKNPQNLYIGIDSNARPLEKISERICRKPQKGGAPGAMYLLANAEHLPEELNGIANRICIFFPWGSLLRGILLGEANLLRSLKRISAPGATLRLAISIDPDKDRKEIQRLGLPDISSPGYETFLQERYREAGFVFLEWKRLSGNELELPETSWAKRLRMNANRSLFEMSAGFSPRIK